MALYQPTNIIPSSYTKGTVDVNDIMEISWQVNGNSAMTAFQIDFYLNDYASTPVTSTGRRTDNIPTGGFYGTDRFGRPQFFTWNSKVSWEDKGFTNGNEYKYKITQWYIEDKDEYRYTTRNSISGGTYFVYNGLIYFSFTLSSGDYPIGTQIIYNTRTKEGYIIQGKTEKEINVTESSIQPTTGTFLGTASNEIEVKQNSFSVIMTRKRPKLTIYRSNESYKDLNDFPNGGDIATSIGFFHANYEQEQGDPIRWIRWQIATVNADVVGEILADTGDIYTPTLNYEFNGFFNGQSYAIRCIGESESGQECDSDWINFNINIVNQNQYSGDFTVQCLNKENATLLEWEGITVIPPSFSPEGYKPSLSNEAVQLAPNSSITWDNFGVDNTGKKIPMSFPPLWTVVWYGIADGSEGVIFELLMDYDNKLTLEKAERQFVLKYNQIVLGSFSSGGAPKVYLITPETVYGLIAGRIIKQVPINIDNWQKAINSVSMFGGTGGSRATLLTVYKGNGDNILPYYQNIEDFIFRPVWGSNNYELYMNVNFISNLEGGTGTATGAGFRVYRQEVGKNVLTPIATVTSTTTSVKDYGIVSRKAYKYSLYAYDNNGAFMNSVENEKVIATCFKNYSLLVCDYDELNDEYHVHKQYLFALNPTESGVGNNNSPTLNANFTRYPTRMPSTQNYASGTLSGLIGAIYTVPALIEQLGNYKWTAKPSTMDYFDNVDLEQELYDLSTAPYQLFLRDMKGRLRMIHTSGPITMTTNIKQKQQSISISLPWVEIGDASDVTIIQTPDDYGWNNDNQVLDVQLDIDVATGELSATYPFPYGGTKFYLTGVNKEILTAKTPLGITPAQFELSDAATQPNDGVVTATITANPENN